MDWCEERAVGVCISKQHCDANAAQARTNVGTAIKQTKRRFVRVAQLNDRLCRMLRKHNDADNDSDESRDSSQASHRCYVF